MSADALSNAALRGMSDASSSAAPTTTFRDAVHACIRETFIQLHIPSVITPIVYEHVFAEVTYVHTLERSHG